MKFRVEVDRHPGRRIWFGSFDETVAGLELKARVKMKPRLLKLSEDRWLRVDAEETLYLERDSKGRGLWHTLRGTFHDLEAPGFEEALQKASRSGVYVQISRNFAVSPMRIVGIRLHRSGLHIVELEDGHGEPRNLELEPASLEVLEECLEALNLGGGFLITGPDEEEP